jgi:formylmethanofuran dehydrogenase subunit D
MAGILDTSLLGRIIHNGRIVRQELKCGNIKPGMEEKAWVLIEMGMLANRYVTLFTESMSQASFYSEPMDVDQHDPEKIVKLENLKQEFVDNYRRGEINRETHPLMRSCKEQGV